MNRQRQAETAAQPPTQPTKKQKKRTYGQLKNKKNENFKKKWK